MLDPRNLKNGQEQHETFKLSLRSNEKRVQYDYRAEDGKLFSCINKTLADCRKARDEWQARRAAKQAAIEAELYAEREMRRMRLEDQRVPDYSNRGQQP